jgi:4,5-DOPA dioxygenase extradiol
MGSKKKLMPVLFIGHGSPMNMLSDNGFTRSLKSLGEDLPRPEAIMVISAHWLSAGTRFSCVKTPEMIYDFYGFPRELYRVVYGCPGSPEFARTARNALKGKSLAECDEEWGLDHAAYSPLRHMFPKADIPVFEMSLDYSFNNWSPKPIAYHYELAKGLSELRRKGVLIIGSGNIVHNLAKIEYKLEAKPYDWAAALDEQLKSYLAAGDHRYLINFPAMEKVGSLAAPTLDHYLPMIYAIALKEKGEALTFTYEGIQNASVSMRCFRIG